jgi:hypothetical protein
MLYDILMSVYPEALVLDRLSNVYERALADPTKLVGSIENLFDSEIKAACTLLAETVFPLFDTASGVAKCRDAFVIGSGITSLALDQSVLPIADFPECRRLASTQLQGFGRTILAVNDPTSMFYNISSRGFKSHPELYKLSDLLASHKAKAENKELGDFLADGIGVTAQAIYLAFNSLKQRHKIAAANKEADAIIAETDFDNLPSSFRP